MLMEPNQTNVSPKNWGIPQGIPTGVFVPNNQTPMTTAPVQEATLQTPWQAPVVQNTEGPLDRVFKRLVRFIAKVTGQPDPITGAPNPTSDAFQKGEKIIGKVRGVANQVVTKATDVAGKAVDTVNHATQQIQQIVPPPTAQQKTPTDTATEQPK